MTERSKKPARVRRLGPGPLVGLLFLLPAAVLLGVWVVYPIVYSVVRSLFDAPGTGFVGLSNYGTLLGDDTTLYTIIHNLWWVVLAPVVVTVLGLVFAVLTERIRWATAFKLIVFMPMAISLMAAGVIFRLVYEQAPDRGVANAVLTTVASPFSSEGYPDARPRESDALTSRDGAIVTTAPAQPGQPVLIPIVGIKQQNMPETARPAAPAAPAQGGGLAGTVWFDFSPGGQGTSGQIDAPERGLPGMTVEAVQDGRVVASATTADDGTFSLQGVNGPAEVRLPKENFSAAYSGVNWLGPAPVFAPELGLSIVTLSIVMAFVWVWAGFAMVLIAAGLAAIPRDALEAARIDGASEWQVFKKITVPLLSPVLVVVFVTMIINTLKVFDLVYIIAPPSVQPQANVIALEMWRVSFAEGDQGLGSALAIFLLLLVLPFMIMNIRRFRREAS
ncbi:sugar ABC transporter permease [Nonomuraea longicatena]|uniref:Sugar ABC transporter permease n=1 Tax=Nonomuraea longicatena TaxID=83682 RepID=A0ABN1QJB2_9ACTN